MPKDIRSILSCRPEEPSPKPLSTSSRSEDSVYRTLAVTSAARIEQGVHPQAALDLQILRAIPNTPFSPTFAALTTIFVILVSSW